MIEIDERKRLINHFRLQINGLDIWQFRVKKGYLQSHMITWFKDVDLTDNDFEEIFKDVKEIGFEYILRPIVDSNGCKHGMAAWIMMKVNDESGRHENKN